MNFPCVIHLLLVRRSYSINIAFTGFIKFALFRIDGSEYARRRVLFRRYSPSKALIVSSRSFFHIGASIIFRLYKSFSFPDTAVPVVPDTLLYFYERLPIRKFENGMTVEMNSTVFIQEFMHAINLFFLYFDGS